MDCTQYQDGFRDAWLNGEWLEAVACPYDAQVGTLTLGLFVYGGVMMGLYVRTGSAVVPGVVTIVAGTVAVSQIPSQAVQLLVVALLLLFTSAGYFLYQRAESTL